MLTAETLLAQFIALVPRLRSSLPADVSTAMSEAQAIYPELWAALDRGRATLSAAPVYDEIRGRQPAAMLGFQVHTKELTVAGDIAAFMVGGLAGVAIDVARQIGAKRGEANRTGLDDASAAIKALRTAMPAVDWNAVHRSEAKSAAIAMDELARARRKKLLVGIGALAVAAMFAVALVMMLKKDEAPVVDRDTERREADEEIRQLNAVLREQPCNAVAAERRVAIFNDHFQGSTAKKLAKQFLETCGENPKLRAIAGK